MREIKIHLDAVGLVFLGTPLRNLQSFEAMWKQGSRVRAYSIHNTGAGVEKFERDSLPTVNQKKYPKPYSSRTTGLFNNLRVVGQKSWGSAGDSSEGVAKAVVQGAVWGWPWKSVDCCYETA